MQVGSIAMAVVAEMERQGKVMVKPVEQQIKPMSKIQAARELNVCERTIRRLVEAGRLDRIVGTSKMLITVDSIREFQKGER